MKAKAVVCVSLYTCSRDRSECCLESYAHTHTVKRVQPARTARPESGSKHTSHATRHPVKHFIDVVIRRPLHSRYEAEIRIPERHVYVDINAPGPLTTRHTQQHTWSEKQSDIPPAFVKVGVSHEFLPTKLTVLPSSGSSYVLQQQSCVYAASRERQTDLALAMRRSLRVLGWKRQ